MQQLHLLRYATTEEDDAMEMLVRLGEESFKAAAFANVDDFHSSVVHFHLKPRAHD